MHLILESSTARCKRPVKLRGTHAAHRRRTGPEAVVAPAQGELLRSSSDASARNASHLLATATAPTSFGC